MANETMKKAIYINNGKKEVITIQNYNEEKHKGKLKCINGCDVDVYRRKKTLQRTESFCTFPNQLNKHTEECKFKNKYDSIYNNDFNTEMENIDDKNIFNSLMRTAKYKVRKKKYKNEKDNIEKYLATKNEGCKCKDILIYRDVRSIKKEDIKKTEKLYGIFQSTKHNEYKKNGEYRYLFLKGEGVTLAIYFKKQFFQNKNNITINQFDELEKILEKHNKQVEIVMYGEINSRKIKGYNICINNINHIVINLLSVEEILRRKGFRKRN